MKHIYTLAILLLSVFAFLSCDRSNNDEVQPTPAEIGTAGKLYSNRSLSTSNTKYYSEEIATLKPGTPVTVLETGHWEDFKVQLPNGTMGWLDAQNLKPAKHTYIKHNAAGPNKNITANRVIAGANRKTVKEVTEKTGVTRLEELPATKDSKNIAWTKVRTDDGIEGWIMSDYLNRIVQDPPRFINRKKWTYQKEYFEKHWTGKPIEKLIKKYKEPSGIKIIDSNSRVYYFNNIFLINDNRMGIGIKVSTQNGEVSAVDYGTKKKCWACYVPLSSVFRINLIANHVGNWDYIMENDYNPYEKGYDLREHMPNWLATVIFILVFILFLVILYYILKIPFIIVNKITYKQSLNRELFNRRILFYAVTGTLILGYLYYLIMITNIYPFKDYFFITSLFYLGMLLGNINKWRNDLDYVRCDAAKCHQWTGVSNGTEFLGGTTETQHIRHGDGTTETNRRTTRRYRDYRKCTACGHEWSIVRTEVVGKLKI